MVSVKFKFDVSKKRLENIVKNDDVLQFTAETFYKYMYDYIPIYTGALANTVEITPKGIWFKQPYAWYLWTGINEYGKKIHLHTIPGTHTEYENARQWLGRDPSWTPLYHKNASFHWGEVAMKNHMDDIIREIEDYIEEKS